MLGQKFALLLPSYIDGFYLSNVSGINIEQKPNQYCHQINETTANISKNDIAITKNATAQRMSGLSILLHLCKEMISHEDNNHPRRQN